MTRKALLYAIVFFAAAGLFALLFVLNRYGVGSLGVKTENGRVSLSQIENISANWKSVANGIRVAEVLLTRKFAFGSVAKFVAVCFEQKSAQFKVFYSPQHKTCQEFATENDLWFCINGSFFATAPLGLVISNGKRITAPHRFMRGFFAVYENGDVVVSVSNQPPRGKIIEAVQSFPALLLEGKPIYGTEHFYNTEARAERSVVASGKNGEICFAVVKGGGVSFAELAQLLAKLNFQNAFCLDGGSSTQMLLHTKNLSINFSGDAVPVVIGAVK